jgi:hypothetical protein
VHLRILCLPFLRFILHLPEQHCELLVQLRFLFQHLPHLLFIHFLFIPQHSFEFSHASFLLPQVTRDCLTMLLVGALDGVIKGGREGDIVEGIAVGLADGKNDGLAEERDGTDVGCPVGKTVGLLVLGSGATGRTDGVVDGALEWH